MGERARVRGEERGWVQGGGFNPRKFERPVKQIISVQLGG